MLQEFGTFVEKAFKRTLRNSCKATLGFQTLIHEVNLIPYSELSPVGDNTDKARGQGIIFPI